VIDLNHLTHRLISVACIDRGATLHGVEYLRCIHWSEVWNWRHDGTGKGGCWRRDWAEQETGKIREKGWSAKNAISIERVSTSA